MALTENEETLLTRYLLGRDIPEDDRNRIQERFFADDAYFDELSALEDELINDYVCGRLSSRDREIFEERLAASSEWRREVVFTRGLVQAASVVRHDNLRPGSPFRTVAAFVASPTWRRRTAYAALIAATCAIVVGGLWLVRTTRQLREDIAQLQRDRGRLDRRSLELQDDLGRERIRAEELAARLQAEQESVRRLAQQQATPITTPQPLLLSFTLTPGLLRAADNGPVRQLVMSSATGIRFQLDLPPEGSHTSYWVILETLDGKQTWSGSARRNPNVRRRVVVELPSTALSPDDYKLSLQGNDDSGKFADIASYYFSVVR